MTPMTTMMKKWILALALSVSATVSLVAAPTAFAAPSVNDVEAAIARGDMQGAQSMLDQVVAAHPNSARAHYLDAQVLERNHRYSDAQTQLNAARTADPSISFTDKGRFATVERRINAEVARTAGSTGASVNSERSSASANTSLAQNTPSAMRAAVPEHHGPSPVMWVLLLVVIAGVIGLVMWGMRKRQRQDTDGATDMQRDQLQRATQMMDAVRASKLDLKLSSSPDKQAWLSDAEAIEAQLRTLIDSLSAGRSNGNRFASNRIDADPGYQLDTLEPQVERIKALAAGRPDPKLAAGNLSPQSAYATEADRLNQAQPGYGQPPPAWQQQPQPQVVVQQPGMGAGVGGLMTGVLLGEMLGGGNRERDVIVEHDRGNGPDQRDASNGGNANSPFDFGNGGDNWGGDGSQIDAGNDDNSWDDNNT